ncbi:MAG TPA: NAD+ synthase [Thermomonas sp.]|jgi:NAD+ synthase (glutamine-hydrolysing)|uniref:NAD+ synthase n=1 Tax=Thermomonas sp. TaxID=1971895 RepID=UPI002C0B2176|nr:NAD+ synthase [Thermomonas sp.]HOZ23483.1 NAD+ synthase [Thermomonas sp.]HPM56313.1 NAD+ synthase [Thermomonas sp.]HPW12939.1 NAD+ synthase [Thermomonas sp.]
MTLRIAMAQFDFPVGDVAGNRDRIARMVTEARDEYQADIVLFPELALSGYPPEDLLYRPSFLRECQVALDAIAADVQGIVAVVGWPQAAGAVVYNAASVLRDGAVEQTYRKRELPNYAVFDERRYFDVDPDRDDCVFEVDGTQVGLVICEDLWFAEPIASTVARGAQLVLVPNASPFERDKHAQRDTLLAQRTGETGAAIAYLNVVGGQDALVFDGASVVADGDGNVHPAAAAFTDQWLVVDFDPATRRFTPVQWMVDGDESRDALAWRAVVRGTRDYFAKNGFKHAWLGLSGGIDSSLVLAIAVDALGAENVTAVRMPSRYTADLSNDLAREQCDAMGVKLIALPIEKPFQGYLDTLAEVFAGKPVDTTEENLQSRTRGAFLMALSNKFGGLVLTTGNKSEYAVGYATIYGDMCGGYAPIKDLYKTEVFALARWRNTVGDRVVPEAVIERPPSAELRPDQKDQDSLPPYDVLDAILLRHVDQEQSRQEIVSAGFDAATVDKVLKLVRIGEWKRHQAAPGPKVSRRAFGRERRYPITNGYRE